MNFRKQYQVLWKSAQWEPRCFTRTDRHDEADGRFSLFCECAYNLYIISHEIFVQ